ncbi:MAG: hypothetical protein ABIG96_03415 [Candidatus Micrarchaeota archaeon]
MNRIAIYLIALIILAGFVSAADFNAFTVTASSSTVGATAVYNLTINVTNDFYNSSNVSIYFPASFNVSLAEVTSSAGLGANGITTVTGQEVKFTYDNATIAAATEISLGISWVVNRQTTGAFNISAQINNETDDYFLDGGGSNIMNLAPGTTHYIIQTYSSTTPTAGESITGQFVALDKYGNERSDFFNYTSTDTLATFTNGTANNTIGIFNLRTAGSPLIRVISNYNSSAQNTTAFSVTAEATPAFITLATFPSTATAGVNFTGSFNSTDRFGNLISDTYDFYSSDASAVLPENNTVTNGGSQGAFQLRTSGEQTISVVSHSNTSITNVSTFLINASTVTKVLLSPMAPTLAFGGTQKFTATAVDAYGNTNTTITGNYTHLVYSWTNLTGNGTLNSSGFFTSVSAGIVNVVVNFSGVTNTTNVTINAAATPTPTPAIVNSISGGNVYDDVPQSTVTPTPTASATPSAIPAKTVVMDEYSSATATFGTSSTSLDLSYTAGRNGFAGTVSYSLPLDYDEVKDKISCTPSCKITRGSVIITWDVSLQPNQEFRGTVVVQKPIEPAVITKIPAPVTKLSQPTVKPTSIATAVPSKMATGNVVGSDYTPSSSGDGNSLFLWIVVIGLLVGGWVYFNSTKKKGKEH